MALRARAVWATAAAAALLAVAAWRSVALSRLAPLGPDAGFTLMKARLLEAGRVPYLDFPVGYGPLQPYVQSLCFGLFGGDPGGLLLQQWTHHLVVLATVVVLARRVAQDWAVTLFCAAVYMASAPALEGFYFILEPTVAAYGWLALAAMLGAGQGAVADRPRASWAACLAFSAGALAGVAAGIKQVGAVFAFAVLSLPLVQRWPARRLCAAAAAAGMAVPFGAFMAAHPAALRPLLADSVWGILLLAVGRRLPFEPLSVRAISLAYTAWIPVALALAGFLLIRRGPAAGARRSLVLLCAAGLALWLPQLTRPYLHYALLPLPFAVLALAFLLDGGGSEGGEVLRPAGRVIVAAMALLPVTAQGWIEGRLLRGQREERLVSAWIARHVAPSAAMLVVPAAPQYYYLTSRPSFDGRYEFFPDPRVVWHASRAGAPVVVVDRAHGRYVALYERELRAAGYRRADALGRHAVWLPPARGVGGALPELRPYPDWLRAPPR